ncbi:MAG: hypothetical protein WA979_04295 [Pacificimonas sp.]
MTGTTTDRHTMPAATGGHAVYVALGWVVMAALLVFTRWPTIGAFALPDTDDVMRMVQVRDWLNGQDFSDVRQYRMMPASGGADMHWSRLVDLPLAGLILLLEPLFGMARAERIAATVVPLIAFLIASLLTARIASALWGRTAAILAGLFTLTASAFLTAIVPLRIDHHGWQIVLLLAVVAALVAARDSWRPGLWAGLALSLSLTIGLETLPFLALIFALYVLRWTFSGKSAKPVIAVCGTVMALLPLLEAIFGVQGPGRIMCDMLSPAYVLLALSACGVTGLTAWAGRGWSVWTRVVALAVGLSAAYAVFALQHPACRLGPVGTIDPRLSPWLSQVGEARAFGAAFAVDPAIAIQMLAVPLFGTLAVLALMRMTGRRDFAHVMLASLCGLATLMVAFVQLRIGVIGAPIAMIALAGLAAHLLPRIRAMRASVMRTLLTAGVLVGCNSVGVSVFGVMVARAMTPAAPPAPPIEIAVISCLDGEALRPLASLKPSMIAAPIDVAPRILLWTPHDSSIGPYHRNVDAILTMVGLWTAAPDEARAALLEMKADHLLYCPAMPEMASAREAGDGLAARLENGDVPSWLTAERTTKAYTLYAVR